MNVTTEKTRIQTLVIVLDDERRSVEISETALRDAEPVLQNMDKDMDKGWQMSRSFIDFPNVLQRCQIAADKMLTALHHDNQAMVSLMSAFIMTRLPDCVTVEPDTQGNVSDTVFYDEDDTIIHVV